MELTGATMQSLEWSLREFDPAQPVEVYLGVDREMSNEEVAAFAQELSRSGLPAHVDFGQTDQWPNAVRLVFPRPAKIPGIAQFPVGGILLATAAAIGIGFIGFSLAAATKSVGESIGKNLVWLALVAAGTLVAISAVKAQQRKAA